MSIVTSHVRDSVIRPVLSHFSVWSPEAEIMLLATCAQETHMGGFLRQVKGPALGIYQMEPATYQDIIENVVTGSSTLWAPEMEAYFGYSSYIKHCDKLIYDLRYATLFCRLQYWRYKEPLPNKSDVQAIYNYWKKYYNRNANTGHFDQFEQNFNKYVTDEI